MSASPQPDQVERDLHMIVGGNFSIDALGHEHTEILKRVRAAPLAYLDAFERLFVARGSLRQDQSNLFLPSFLKLVADVAPDRVRSLATRLLGQYDAALSIADHAIEHDPNAMEALPERTSRMIRHMDQRRRQLRVLLGQPGGRP